MTIKTGNIVSHAGALQWGAGKVLEVTATKMTIRFSDGQDRKIAASHYGNLQAVGASLYVPPPVIAPVEKVRPAVRKARKTK